jgi:hypothetical protein
MAQLISIVAKTMNKTLNVLRDFKQDVMAIAKRHQSRWNEIGFPDVFAVNFWDLQPQRIDAIDMLEEKIQRVLPKDYREFLENVGEFALPGFGCGGRILGTSDACMGSMKSPDFPGRKSRLRDTVVLNQPLDKDGQFSVECLGLQEYLDALVITDDNNSGKAAGFIRFEPKTREASFEYIYDEAWTGSIRFKKLESLIRHITNEALRSLGTFDL